MMKVLAKIAVAVGIGIATLGCSVEVADEQGGELIEPSPDDSSGDSAEPLEAWNATQLRFGLTGTMGSEIFGKGPVYVNGAWTSSEPIYRVVLGRISPGDLPARIKEANEKDILLVLNMAGSRNTWTIPKTINGKACKIYDPVLYRQRIDAFVGVPGLKEALAKRRVIIYVVDEPHIVDFCNSITPTQANAMARYVKQKFPGAITLMRMSATTMTNGFAGEGPLGPNFWSGVDYGYGLYKGWMKQKLGKTVAQWLPEEKKRFAALNIGMVMGLNNLNHGDWACWDYLKNGSSWGRVRGQNQALNGGVPCSQGTGGETNWLASPSFLREVADAAVKDPDSPFLVMWTHITPTSNDQVFKQYEVRSDYVAAYKYMINKGKQRTQWNGWRTAK